MAYNMYNLINLTDEIIETHKSMLVERVSTKDVQDDIVEVLGGIDNILASALQQSLLTEEQLSKLKTIFSSKQKMIAPDLQEMDSMLDEIEDAADKKPFGQEQSPINLMTYCGFNSTTLLMSDAEAHGSPLKFNYPALVEKCTIENNGHTVQINIDPSQKCTLSIKGKTYQLVQFHFHTPAEHMIDSKLFDMEMHLVHANEKSELAVLGFIFSVNVKYQQPKLELTQSRAHLVLSKESMDVNTENTVKCIPCDANNSATDDLALKKLGDKKGNDFLAQFFDQLPMKKTEQDIPLDKPLSFDYLFETASRSFAKNVKTNEIDIDMELFEYDGGLTTPPFSEGVQWLVSKQLHFMNKTQLKNLSAAWGNVKNSRPCQDYYGRVVKLRSKSSMQVN